MKRKTVMLTTAIVICAGMLCGGAFYMGYQNGQSMAVQQSAAQVSSGLTEETPASGTDAMQPEPAPEQQGAEDEHPEPAPGDAQQSAEDEHPEPAPEDAQQSAEDNHPEPAPEAGQQSAEDNHPEPAPEAGQQSNADNHPEPAPGSEVQDEDDNMPAAGSSEAAGRGKGSHSEVEAAETDAAEGTSEESVSEDASIYAAEGITEDMSEEAEKDGWDTESMDIRSDEQLRQIYDECIAGREASGQNWAVSIVDLSTGERYGYRENEVQQSASVLKLFIMGAIYDRVIEPSDESKRVEYVSQYDGEVRDLLYNMITVSDNESANRLTEILGGGDFTLGTDVIRQFCEEYGFNGTSMGRRFMSFVSASDNYTCAADTAKILSMIYNGTLVSEASSQEMLSYLKQQTRTWKIPAGLPEGYSSANKTGEIDGQMGFVENDTAIIFGPEKNYVLCVLSSNLNGDNGGAQSNIQRISQITAGILK